VNGKDPEIVGEFLMSLKILQYSATRDPTLTPFVHKAKRFLLDTELRGKDGKPKGQWKGYTWETNEDKGHRLYLKYHAAYCVAVGLVDFESDFANADPDRPNFINLLALTPTV